MTLYTYTNPDTYNNQIHITMDIRLFFGGAKPRFNTPVYEEPNIENIQENIPEIPETNIPKHISRKDVGFIRFKLGLEERGIKYQDLMTDWKYVGGDGGSRGNSMKNYQMKKIHQANYKFNYGDNDYPPLDEECVCGHYIQENCYLARKDDISTMMIVGSCCIRRFMGSDTMKRKCIKCDANTQCKNRICGKCEDKVELAHKRYKQKKNAVK